ncbi:hypothetical protein ARMSODRAFT_955175 [Armillaria solidipes]|uniref:Uncharacterized protein n=1 Tax=Armillaria solidipes TaxID=1076256 RepID=A0A2H3BZ92_9AGAR|nr:hypothetical protein ARMSODRAFT_955175 [Armillaria solidipes]
MQIYLKPRPISRKYGHSNYLTFKYPFDNYGPFFADYGTIPSDATEVYTVRPSSPLPASLSKLYNELLPSFDAEVPDPNKLPRSKWGGGLLQLAVAKVDSSFYFQLECEDHIVRLVKGDRAPAPPPTSRRTADLSPEWYKIVYSTLLRGEVEVRDDADLELFVWAYLYSKANRVHIWRGLRAEMIQLTKPFFAAHLPSAYTDNSGLLKAASAIASVFATKTPIEPPPLTPSSMDENKPPLLFPSSSSSHTGDVDSDDDNRPFRRRNRIVSSDQ